MNKKTNGHPSLKDGFYLIANELSDARATTTISGQEHCMVEVCFRGTYGIYIGKDEDGNPIKNDLIELNRWEDLAVPGIHKQNIKKILKSLEAKKILIIDWENKAIQFSKIYTEWLGYNEGGVEYMEQFAKDQQEKAILRKTQNDNVLPNIQDNPQGDEEKSNPQITNQSSTDYQKVIHRLPKSNPQITKNEDKPNEINHIGGGNKYNKYNKEKKDHHHSNIYNIAKIVPKNDDDDFLMKKIQQAAGGFTSLIKNGKEQDEVFDILEQLKNYKKEAIDDCLSILSREVKSGKFTNRNPLSSCRFIETCLKNKGDSAKTPPEIKLPEGMTKEYVLSMRNPLISAVRDYVPKAGFYINLPEAAQILMAKPHLTRELLDKMWEYQNQMLGNTPRTDTIEGVIELIEKMEQFIKTRGHELKTFKERVAERHRLWEEQEKKEQAERNYYGL